MTYLYKIGGTLYMSDFTEDDLKKAYKAATEHYQSALTGFDVSYIIEGAKMLRMSNEILVRPEVREVRFE